jgi:hypothetical protein
MHTIHAFLAYPHLAQGLITSNRSSYHIEVGAQPTYCSTNSTATRYAQNG